MRLLLLALSSSLAALALQTDQSPTIGADTIPAGLHCQEDEAIVLTPEGVVCINVEEVGR